MKYRVLPTFQADYHRLSPEEKRAFRDALARFIAAAREYEKDPVGFRWPASLRVEKLVGQGVMAMTWSFSGPDGRATFQIDQTGGEVVVVWRRVGRHSIYREP